MVGVDVEVGTGVSVGGVVVPVGVVVVGVAVDACSAGAATATPASPVSSPKLEDTARATSPARRTNARRVIRRSHTRAILTVRRFTEGAS